MGGVKCSNTETVEVFFLIETTTGEERKGTHLQPQGRSSVESHESGILSATVTDHHIPVFPLGSPGICCQPSLADSVPSVSGVSHALADSCHITATLSEHKVAHSAFCFLREVS